ncbi:hypothetical protein KOI35_35980 [Actinoplanes bogorensis]|uniref:Uncharacterized protein n=1 Tax=Paractinoplanes bogorensis TaxID=1610840 RepID=A0ABS5YZP8_9ACTN|nr:hypothetical protein [Actinoplanes bogorensis]
MPSEPSEDALHRILSSPRAARRRTGKRFVVSIALAAGILASGAAATGLLPRELTNALSFWGDDARTAQRVAQEPGPDGRVLSVWRSRDDGGDVCIAPMFEGPGPLDRPAPRDFSLAGGQCTQPGAPVEPFGNVGGSSDGNGVHTMWITAGDAVRAELRSSDGSTRAALKAVDLFFVWYRGGPATVVGFDASGAEIGRTTLPDLGR